MTSSQPLSPKIRFRILFGCMTALFLAALDQTIVAPALPAIAGEFGDWGNVSWVVTAYLLVATVVIPIYGRASDVYGRRPVMAVAIAIFCLGSVLCALSSSMVLLSLARGVQALGGGGLISIAMTVVGDIFEPRERGRYQGYISGVYAFAALLGPTLGGVISDYLHWTVIFWINLPIGIVAACAALSGMGYLRHVERPRNLDLTGAALFVCGVGCLVLTVSSGGTRWAWTSEASLLSAAVSVLFITFFIARIMKTEDALISHRVVSDRVIVLSVATAALAVGTSIGLSTFVPTFFQIVLGLSPTLAGLALVPMMFGVAIGATLSGRSLVHFTNYKILPTVGLCCAATIVAGLALSIANVSAITLSVVLGFVSIGIGSVMPVSMIVVQNAADRSELGSATALMGLSRQLGGVLLVAVFGTVLFGGGHNVALSDSIASPDTKDLVAGQFSVVLGVAAANLVVAILLFLGIEQRQLGTGGK